MIQTSTSFIGIIIGSYGISQMVLRLPVGLLANYRNKHKMIMLIGSLSSGCASLFRIIFNNGIGFFNWKSFFQDLPVQCGFLLWFYI